MSNYLYLYIYIYTHIYVHICNIDFPYSLLTRARPRHPDRTRVGTSTPKSM